MGSWGRWSRPEAEKVVGPAVTWRGAHSCCATGSGHIWRHIWHVAAAGGGEGCVPWLLLPGLATAAGDAVSLLGKGIKRQIMVACPGCGGSLGTAPFPSDSLLKLLQPQHSSLQGKKMPLPFPSSLG